MNITQVGPNFAAADSSASSGVASRTAKKSLDSTDFMKLLAVQFQKQDPMKPMEDTAFIAQMAQFTALEQTNGISAEISRLRLDQQAMLGSSYLGKAVTFAGADGKDVTGVVSALENSAGGVALVVGDASVPLSAVKRIETAAVNARL